MNPNTVDFEALLEQGRNAFGPVVELGELTMKTVEELARQQFDATGDYVDFGLQQVEVFGRVRDLSDLNDVVADQGRIAGEFADKVKGRAEAFSKTAVEAQQAYAEWFAGAFRAPAAAATPKARKKAA